MILEKNKKESSYISSAW